MKSEHTFFKVVDQCDRLRWGNVLALTVEDTKMTMIMIIEVCGQRLLVPGVMYIKRCLLSDHEDFIIFLDLQSSLDGGFNSTDARDGEGFVAGELCHGDHGQVSHSICRTRGTVVTPMT